VRDQKRSEVAEKIKEARTQARVKKLKAALTLRRHDLQKKDFDVLAKEI